MWGLITVLLYMMRGESIPGSDNFLLLSGADFLLLDMTNFLLLGGGGVDFTLLDSDGFELLSNQTFELLET